jgi:hypothetical protein
MLGDLQLETIKDKMCLMYMEYLGLRYRCVLYAVLYFDRLLCKARFFAYFARSIVRTKTAAYGGVRFFKGVKQVDMTSVAPRLRRFHIAALHFTQRILAFTRVTCTFAFLHVFPFIFDKIAVNDSSPRSLGID